MKKLLIAALFAAATLAPVAASAQNVQVCLREGSRPGNHLRMRAYPAENAPSVERAYHGETVLIVRRQGKFSLIMDYLGTRGWVPNRYLCAY